MTMSNTDVSFIKRLSLEDIKNAINNLPLEAKEQLALDLLDNLSKESRQRVGKDEGIIVVTGGSNFVSNASLCIQIQNAPNIDIASIIEAATIRHKKDRIDKN